MTEMTNHKFQEDIIMKPEHDRPLLAYAYLAQSGAQGDIISGLIPIIAPIAKTKSGEKFEPVDLCTELQKLYGIDVHPWVIDELTPRLEEAEILIPERINNNLVRHYYSTNLSFDLDKLAEQEIKEIANEFADYCEPILRNEALEIEKELISKIFLNQLTSLNFHAAIIRPQQSHRDNKILTLKANRETQEPPELTNNQLTLNKIKLLSAAFILDLNNNDAKKFALLAKIATGAIVAEYILNLRDPGSVKSLAGLRFYLDGPLAMSYLDLTDETAHKHAKKLIDLLLQKGASLYIFNHHVDEITENLRAAINKANSGDGHRATFRRLRGASFKNYVTAILSDTPSALRRSKIYPIDAQTESSQYFTKDQETALISALGIYSAHARQRDAAAISGIMRLRKERKAGRSEFHQCGHIFITENKRVANNSTQFIQQEKIYKNNEIPAAVTDRYLAGLMLVLFGGSATAEIAHLKLIANCASALEPSQELLSNITTFLESTDKTRADTFKAMMTTGRSVQYMSKVLLEDRITINTSDEAEAVLARLESELKDSLESEYVKVQIELQKEHNEELEEKQKNIQALQQQLTEEQIKTERKITALALDDESNQHKIKALEDGLQALLNQQTEDKEREIQKVQKALEQIISDETIKHSRISSFMFLLLAAATSLIVTFVAYVSTGALSQQNRVLVSIAIFLSTLLSSKILKNFITKKISHMQETRIANQIQKNLIIAENVHNFKIDYQSGTVERISK